MLGFLSWFLYFIIFLLGLALGSYLNSWMWRIHEGKWVFLGRSICVHCSRELAWYENIPLFSYLFLKRKCRTCKKIIPSSYFFVELSMGLLFVLVAFAHLGTNVEPSRLFRDLLFTALLVVTFVYDAKYQIIIPGVVWLGAIFGAFVNLYYLHYSLVSLLVGAAIGGGFFLFQYVVSKGRWIGGGDVRFGVLMGVWLGWQGALLALFISYMSGAAISLLLLAMKQKKMTSEIPFGTFLSAGTFIAMLWGAPIISWYLGLLK